MLIDPKHQFVFLRPLKCASTSVEGFLRQYVSAEAFGVPLKPWEEKELRALDQGPIRERRVPMRLWLRNDFLGGGTNFRFGALPEFQSHQSAESVRAYLGENQFKTFNKVSITRNPFDRMVSWFYFLHYDSVIQLPPEVQRERFHRFVVTKTCRLSQRANAVTSIGRTQVIDTWLRFESLQEDLDGWLGSLAQAHKTYLPLSSFRFKSGTRLGRPSAAFLFSGSDPAVWSVREHFAFEFDFHGYPSRPEGADGW